MASETFEVRIPQHFVESLHTGDITPSMLLTLVLLHNWANWRTGRVECASAQTLATASNDAYHQNTFQDWLKRWGQHGQSRAGDPVPPQERRLEDAQANPAQPLDAGLEDRIAWAWRGGRSGPMHRADMERCSEGSAGPMCRPSRLDLQKGD